MNSSSWFVGLHVSSACHEGVIDRLGMMGSIRYQVRQLHEINLLQKGVWVGATSEVIMDDMGDDLFYYAISPDKKCSFQTILEDLNNRNTDSNPGKFILLYHGLVVERIEYL